MTRKRFEPTLPENPHQLTINQHIHSRSSISRFADAKGRVLVVEREPARTFPTNPGNPIFCALRAWSQHLEHGLFGSVERRFHCAVESIVVGGTVAEHDAVTEYLSIWQILAHLAAAPPEDAVVRGVEEAPSLTKAQEETIESKHGSFMRGSSVPGRLAAFFEVLPNHDAAIAKLKGVRWGVLRVKGNLRFICPDSPANELYIPITPELALIAGFPDQEVDDVAVRDLNQSLCTHSRRFVFGHPRDVQTSCGGF